MESDASIPPPSGQSGSVATSAPTSGKKRKTMALRSPLWADYERFTTPDGMKMAHCKACGAEVRADTSRNGTSSLRSHNATCKARIKQADSSQTVLGFTPGGDTSKNTMTTLRCDPETIRKALVQLIISAELPFRFVARQEFIHFMSIVCPNFKVPSRWTVQRDCYENFSREKEKLKEYFRKSCQRVCLTTDTWTSIQRVNYMCLTAHYIDENWVLHKQILSFCPITSHKGKDIGIVIDKCLRDWGLERIFTITVDNASSNDVAIRFLKDKYCNKVVSVMKCELLHLRCVAHIINLIVKDGLKLMSDSVKRVREVVGYMRTSPQRLAKFKECVEAEKIESRCGLILDVPTRWNSTYLMLDAALKFEKAFVRYDDDNDSFRRDLENEDGICMIPNSLDWENVGRLVIFLKQFYELTLKVSGSKFVTSNCFFHEMVNLDEALREWQGSSDVYLVEMAKSMKTKYEKYWEDPEKMNKLIFVAVIFDPRQKLDYVELCLNDMYGEKADVMIEQVKDIIYALFHDYKRRWVLENGEDEVNNDGNDGDSVEKGQTSNQVINSEVKMMQRLERLDKRKKGSGNKDGKSELDKYLGEDRETTKANAKFDILAYWKVNAFRFPILGQMAREILAMPISTVASESAFSTGGRMLDAFRSSLGSKSVEALICTQDWLQRLYQLGENEEDPLEQEIFENEIAGLSLDAQSRAP